MYRIARLAMIPAVFAFAFGCSDIEDMAKSLGTFDVDGPVVVEMALAAVPYNKSTCSDLAPRFSLSWTGEEGDVTLDIDNGTETWSEDARASRGDFLTEVTGTWRATGTRCVFDASLELTPVEPMRGAINITAIVDYLGGSAESLNGEASVEPLSHSEG